MDLSRWFEKQLQASGEGFLWAVEQIPQERLYLAPRSDRWPVARVIYHVACYEQRLGLPSMRQWLGGPRPLAGTQKEDLEKEEQQWNNGQGHDIARLTADFKSVHDSQLALLKQFAEHNWDEEREAIWGHVSLKWVVTKTYQHTLEHADEILRAYLWGQ